MTRGPYRGYPDVDRHLGMWCGCSLLDCCHNEQDGERFSCGRGGRHFHSGSPATGSLSPWTQEEWDAQQRYWNRPDPGEYPEGSLERLVIEAELEEWRKREQDLAEQARPTGSASATPTVSPASPRTGTARPALTRPEPDWPAPHQPVSI